jgi:ATP-dependent Lon protease
MEPKLIELPILPLRDVVVFPHTTIPLYVGREKSLRAIEEAQKNGDEILLVAQRQTQTTEPSSEDLFSVATLALIKQFARLNDGNVKLLIEAKARVRIHRMSQVEPFLKAEFEILPDQRTSLEVEQKWMTTLLSHCESFFKVISRSFAEVAPALQAMTNPHELVDTIASQLPLRLKDRLDLLECQDPIERIEMLSRLLLSEVELIKIDRKIKDQVREKIEKSQKEYFLNEQMSAIQKELGSEGDLKEEIRNLENRLAGKNLPEFAKEKATKELKRLKLTSSHSPEAAVIRNYVELILDLPWNEFSEDNEDLARAEQILNEDHFGLKDVKERILEFLAVRARAKNHRSPIICFLGPPGVGKTSLARSIARALGRKFERISLGGLRDEAELRGHRRTYIGALPGKIISVLKKAKASNPVILLDEIDKVGMDFRGDPASTLLEILDPEQNKFFTDHYLDIEYDLSKVLFIATVNILDPISAPLRDRMEIISLSGYSEAEKIAIAKQYLLPRETENHGLQLQDVKISDESFSFLIQNYTRESGVRSLQKEIAKICRKFVKERSLDGKEASLEVTVERIQKLLGVPKFRTSSISKQAEIGVVTGLAWTPHGGELLTIEANVLPGKGEIQITGQLGSVMQESAKAALSFIRSIASKYDLDESYFSTRDIHIHVPEGAIPKDGPSAGITIAAAILSSILKIKVPKTVGMTGEITLRGRVLPIGGLKEKLLAAQRGHLKVVFYPFENEKDKADIDPELTEGLELIPVYDMSEVTKWLLKDWQPKKTDSDFSIHQQGVGSPLGPSCPLL